MSDYSEFNSQYEQIIMEDTAYKNKKQNKIEGVSIHTAKTNLKLKFYHNKTSTFGMEGVCRCRCSISFHTAI